MYLACFNNRFHLHYDWLSQKIPEKHIIKKINDFISNGDCFTNKILKDNLIRIVIDFLRQYITKKTEHFSKFRAYLREIVFLCNTKKIACEFFNQGITKLLMEIYPTMNQEDIETIWQIHQILIILKDFGLSDFNGDSLVQIIIDHEGEYFGDYDDRTNFQEIIKNLKTKYLKLGES